MNTERICPGCMHDNGGEKICPVCGYNSVTENNGEDALKVKTILKQRYFIGKKLSVNSGNNAACNSSVKPQRRSDCAYFFADRKV